MKTQRLPIHRLWLVWMLVGLMAACQPQAVTPDPKIRQQERASLPAVTIIQKWQQLGSISQPENTAPSIIPLDNGDYRLYWNTPSLNGIGSAISPDGLRFNADEGARLINAPAGQPDCALGKAWVVPVVNGYRLYYQAQSDNCNTTLTTLAPNARILSAFSNDGQNFTRDAGIRVDVGEVTNLSAAGRGRVIQMDNGSFRMYFAALLPDKGSTPYIMTATSIDTLAWGVDAKPLLEAASDPTALQVENTIQLYVTYMTDNILLLQSSDGVTFTPTAWLEFYDSDNKVIAQMSAMDIIDLSDGSLVIYGSGAGTKGILSFKQQAVP